MSDYDKIYDRNSTLNISFRIEVKRKLKTEGYEASFKDIKDLVNGSIFGSGFIGSITSSIANDTFAFGSFIIPSFSLTLISHYGEFNDEENENSIWSNFIRHESLIKIYQIYTDYRGNKTGEVELFYGFINDTSNSTRVDKDNIKQILRCDDLLSYLLKKYNYSILSEPLPTTLNELIFNIMSKEEFTEFLTVDTDNIEAGYNIQNITYEKDGEPIFGGGTDLLKVLENFAIGHSTFYQVNGIFYFKHINSGIDEIHKFATDKIINFSFIDRGIEKVYDNLFWEKSTAKYVSTTQKFGRSKTIEIKGVESYQEQINILTTIGLLSSPKRGFTLEVPFYGRVKLRDIIKVDTSGFVEDGFILGKSILGVDFLRPPSGASTIDNNSLWFITKLKHDTNKCTTTMTLREYI